MTATQRHWQDYRIVLATLLIYIVASLVTGSAQQARAMAPPSDTCYIYRLYLTDKQGSAHTLTQPHTFLSPRAIARRQRQHLRVDSTDLPVSARYTALIRQRGYTLIGSSKWNNTLLVATPSPTAQAALQAFPFVREVRRVYAGTLTSAAEPPMALQADTLPPTPSNSYGQAYAQLRQLGGDALHEAGFRGKGMLIAVVDGGFHNAQLIPALRRARVSHVRDFVYPYRDNLFHLLDHGTKVFSCMAAVDSFRYVGTAPEATYMLLRSEYGPTESLYEEDTWAMAVEYADSVGADLINASLGYALFDDDTTSHRHSDLDGHATLISHTASLLATKGILLVCSAGNAGHDSWKTLTPPADALQVLTVGAVDAHGRHASFSSVGPTADGRVKPDVVACGVGTQVVTAQGCVRPMQGTSFATPVVCGLAACLWQALPPRTATDIIRIIQASAHRYAHPDSCYGYGLPHFGRAYQQATNSCKHKATPSTN